MANSVQIISDTTRKVVVKLWGDASEPNPTLKVDAGLLAFALNANNRIASTPGTDRKSKYRLELAKVLYDVQSGDTRGYVKLMWNGDSPNTIITLSGSGELRFSEGSDVFTVNNAVAANSTGNVLLSTAGFNANCAYSIFATFKKNAGDYDQGQTADPTGFPHA